MAKEKKKTIAQQHYVPQADMQRYTLWAIRKGYRIYPITKDNQNYQIAIELGTKKAVLSTFWDKKWVYYATYDAYKIVYEKHNS